MEHKLERRRQIQQILMILQMCCELEMKRTQVLRLHLKATSLIFGGQRELRSIPLILPDLRHR